MVGYFGFSEEEARARRCSLWCLVKRQMSKASMLAQVYWESGGKDCHWTPYYSFCLTTDDNTVAGAKYSGLRWALLWVGLQLEANRAPCETSL